MTIFGDPFWAEILSIVNIVFFGLLGIFAFRYAFQIGGYLKIIYILLALVGMYWTGIYLFVLLTPASARDAVRFGQIFIRPAFTFTGAIMATLMLRYWRDKK